MYKLLRLHYEGVGHREARFDPLTLDFRGEPDEAPQDTAIWLRNGGGKTSLLALFFALLQPRRADFLGGGHSLRKRTRVKRLEDYLAPGDVGHVVAEWGAAPEPGQLALDGARPRQRLVTGQVLTWRRSAGQETVEPHFYAFHPRPPLLELDDLPFRRDPRHRTPAGEFVSFLTRTGQANPGLAMVTTESRREWQDYLGRANLDPEIIRYQLSMNEHEGGAEEFLDFRDGDSFVAFLLRLVTDPAGVQTLQKNVAKVAEQFAARPNLQLELAFAEGVLERLPDLIAVREQVGAARLARATAVAGARRLHSRLSAAAESARCEQAEQQERCAELDRQIQDTTRERDTWRERVTALEREVARLRLVEARAARAAAREEVDRLERDARAWALVEDVRREREQQAQVAVLRAALDRLVADADGLRRAYEAAASRYRLRLGLQVEALASRVAEEEQAALTADGRARAAEAGRLAAAARLAGLDAEQKSLEGQLAAARGRLAALVEAGALRPSESIAAALARVERAAAAVAERLCALEEAQASLEATREGLLDERSAFERRLAELRGRLDRLREERQRLAARVERLLKTPEVEEWTEGVAVDLGEVAAGLQTHLATQAAEADRELTTVEVGVQEARRSAHALRTTGLLPPTGDVEEACRILEAQRIPAEPGWVYLERTAPLADRAALVGRSPDLASGVTVNAGDLDRAIRALEGKLVPHQPLTVAESAAWTEEPERPAASRYVLAPSPAHHDPAAAAEELVRCEALLEASEARRRRLEARRDRVREASAALGDLLSIMPPGGLAGLDRSVAETDAERAAAEAEATALGERLAALARELAGHAAERRALGEERLRLRDWLARLEASRSLDEQVARWEGRIAALSVERREADEARRAADEAVQRERAAADSARDRMVQANADRAVVQAQLDRVPAVAGELAVSDDPAVTTQRLEQEYRLSLDRYEQKTSGSETALQLRVSEEALGVLRARLDSQPEESVRRANELLDGPEGVTPEASRLAARRAIGLTNAAREALGACERDLSEAEKAARSAPSGREIELPDDLRPSSYREAEAIYEKVLRRHGELRGRCGDLEAQRSAVGALVERADDRVRNLGILADNLRPVLVDAGPDPADEMPADEAPGDEDGPLDVEAGRGAVPAALAEIQAAGRALDESLAALRRSARTVESFVREDRFAKITGPLRDTLLFATEEELAASAEEKRDEFAKRLVWIRKDLDDLQAHRARVAQALLYQVKDAFSTLERAQGFRLPDGLGDWSGHSYLRISYEHPEPDLLRSRLEAFVDELMNSGVARLPEGVPLLIDAVRAAVGNRQFEVRVLKPNEGLPRTRASVAEIGSWSGGQKLTTALLLYCVLVHLRGLSRLGQRSLQSSTLILDNPIGTANHIDLVDLQIKVARALGVQLIITTGLADHDALAAFPNVIRLRNLKDRPSGRGYVRLDGDRPADGEAGQVVAARVYRLPGWEVSG